MPQCCGEARACHIGRGASVERGRGGVNAAGAPGRRTRPCLRRHSTRATGGARNRPFLRQERRACRAAENVSKNGLEKTVSCCTFLARFSTALPSLLHAVGR